MTGMLLHKSYRDFEQYGSEAAAKSPFYGMWNVEELVVDGEVRPPWVTDETRWRRMFFNTLDRCTIQLMSDSRERYDLEHDETKRTLVLSKRTDPDWKTTLVYSLLQPDVLYVEGSFDGQNVRARLRRTEPPEFLLVTRGFHLINDRPLNR